MAGFAAAVTAASLRPRRSCCSNATARSAARPRRRRGSTGSPTTSSCARPASTIHATPASATWRSSPTRTSTIRTARHLGLPAAAVRLARHVLRPRLGGGRAPRRDRGGRLALQPRRAAGARTASRSTTPVIPTTWRPLGRHLLSMGGTHTSGQGEYLIAGYHACAEQLGVDIKCEPPRRLRVPGRRRPCDRRRRHVQGPPGRRRAPAGACSSAAVASSAIPSSRRATSPGRVYGALSVADQHRRLPPARPGHRRRDGQPPPRVVGRGADPVGARRPATVGHELLPVGRLDDPRQPLRSPRRQREDDLPRAGAGALRVEPDGQGVLEQAAVLHLRRRARQPRRARPLREDPQADPRPPAPTAAWVDLRRHVGGAGRERAGRAGTPARAQPATCAWPTTSRPP